MLLKRQQLLLAMLDILNEPVAHTDFQKLLFFFTQKHEAFPSYDFVPYKFGGFSFTSYADKRKLVEKGLLTDDEHNWCLTEAGRLTARQQAANPLHMMAFCRQYAKLRGDALITEQYRQFPYYASRSEIVDRLKLDPETLAQIAAARTKHQAAGLLTIGYEGRTLERYLNELLQAGVTVLCDVRRNPLSRKYGFSKGTLGKACEGVGIRYEHLPELGIASAERQDLHTQADYEALFAAYERQTLPLQSAALEKIRGWIAGGERAALTCYEALPAQCHRHCVAKALERMTSATLRAQHL